MLPMSASNWVKSRNDGAVETISRRVSGTKRSLLPYSTAGAGQVDVKLFTSDLLALYLACRVAASQGFTELGPTPEERHRRVMHFETWAGFFLAAAYSTEVLASPRPPHRPDLTLTELLATVDDQDWRPMEERPADDQPGVH